MKATSFSSSISANLGNSGEAMVKIHTHTVYTSYLSVPAILIDLMSSLSRASVALNERSV